MSFLAKKWYPTIYKMAHDETNMVHSVVLAILIPGYLDLIPWKSIIYFIVPLKWTMCLK